jgi:mycothiol synthase
MTSETKLAMEWPQSKLDSPPAGPFPSGYRPSTTVDRQAFTRIQASIGWRMRKGQWPSFMDALVPGSMVLAEHEASGEMVGVACGTHEAGDPGSAELGWVAVVPKHRGKGLGMAVCAAATTNILDAGYQRLHLSTNDHRLAALCIYLQLGYEPLVDDSNQARWRSVHQQLAESDS